MGKAKFEIYHIYSVRENRSVKSYATYGHSAGQPNIDHYIYSHFVICVKLFTEYKQKTKKQTNKQHCETKLNLIDPPPPPNRPL